ncbi:MAG: PilX N-terminal domain-containing pilus assembly protein [Steroidobacteraceae bacterium]|jgi:type IV pilus assembly protein PilX
MNDALRLNYPQRGMVLISSLLMLVVVTVLAIALFHSFGLDEKIAGNTREKQRALQAAVSAEQYAEWWLSIGNAVSMVTCAAPVVTAPTVQVCSNTLPSVLVGGAAGIAVLPWQISGGNVGVSYTPPGVTVATGNSITAGTYYQAPVFYISYLGVGTGANGAQGSVYQIDAAGYGGSPNAAAVVESTYILQTSDQDLGGTN